MIKLIVTDVDGTLVEDGFTNVDPRLFDTILKLREKGIQFAVASGRPWASVERTFDPVRKKVVLYFQIMVLILAAMAEACMYMPWTGRS